MPTPIKTPRAATASRISTVFIAAGAAFSGEDKHSTQAGGWRDLDVTAANGRLPEAGEPALGTGTQQSWLHKRTLGVLD